MQFDLRILIIANTGWYLYKFRYNLIKALSSRGDSVCISCPQDDYSRRLVDELSVGWQPLVSAPRRIVLKTELRLVFDLRRACSKFKPDACLTYTPRINCYVALLPLRLKNTILIRNISGLGDSLRLGSALKERLVRYLYRKGRGSRWTFYQNEEDMALGLQEGFSRKESTSLLPGSGVDLSVFQYRERDWQPPHKLLLAARLIPAKGYLDFIELARRLRSRSEFEFHLVGEFTEESGVPETDFAELIKDSGVIYHGYVEDMTIMLEQCDVFVLPSTYGEGLPRVLLEAAACGCLLMAYENAGSNRAIVHGINGWIAQSPSVEALENIVGFYLALTEAERASMAKASRIHVEEGFSEQLVIDAYLSLLAD